MLHYILILIIILFSYVNQSKNAMISLKNVNTNLIWNYKTWKLKKAFLVQVFF